MDHKRAPTGTPPAPQSSTPTKKQQVIAGLDGSDPALAGYVHLVDVETFKITDGSQVVWDLSQFKNLAKRQQPPQGVDPNLWTHACQSLVAGLFKVDNGIYQVRSFDASNMTILEYEDKDAMRVVIIDPLSTAECSKKALEEYTSKRQPALIKPVVVSAVICTHSHVDHFGGITGVLPADYGTNKDFKIVAPDQFMEHAVAENVYVGHIMGRRTMYSYYTHPLRSDWPDLAKIDAGIGKSLCCGQPSFVDPTHTVIKQTTTMDPNTNFYELTPVVIGGIKMVFQLTPGTEAPSEFNIFFPDHNVLCLAENACRSMHNIQTLRGARVRDCLNWSKYLNNALNLYGDAKTVFTQHHWPVFTSETDPDAVKNYIITHRDGYRFLHDQTVRVMNKGYNGAEIAEYFTLPYELAQADDFHSYYGSLSHNVKAVYDFYMGWFDGNPVTLFSHTATDSAKLYVKAMGGAARVMEIANTYIADKNKDYDPRWAAQLAQHVVYASAEGSEDWKQALQLLDTILSNHLAAYASDVSKFNFAFNANWRNFCVAGAYECRQGFASTIPFTDPNVDQLDALSDEQLMDMLATRIIGQKALDRVKRIWGTSRVCMTWHFQADPAYALKHKREANPRTYVVEISNGALSYHLITESPTSTTPVASTSTATSATKTTPKYVTGEDSDCGLCILEMNTTRHLLDAFLAKPTKQGFIDMGGKQAVSSIPAFLVFLLWLDSFSNTIPIVTGRPQPENPFADDLNPPKPKKPVTQEEMKQKLEKLQQNPKFAEKMQQLRQNPNFEKWQQKIREFLGVKDDEEILEKLKELITCVSASFHMPHGC